MTTLSLNGVWDLEMPINSDNSEHFPAKVPGSVYAALLAAGKMEDPFYRDNEMAALALIENDFVFSRAFCVPPELLACERILLRFEGIDTVADVFLNGALLFHADNMHITWEADVTGKLRQDENLLCMKIDSPTRHIREAYQKSRADGAADAMQGFPLLRKAHCMFGWDWGARLPDAGIWRDVTLLGINGARIVDVLVEQTHEEEQVALNIKTTLDEFYPGKYEVRVKLTAPDGETYTASGADCSLTVKTRSLVAKRPWRSAALLHRGDAF